jgi:ABC-2 type transport system ATP-binding protein
MRRRLDVAASLVSHPKVLFLDEPTTGLDPASRADVWVMIETLAAEGTTVLLTTQYLEEADRLAEQLVVIDRGKVIAEGTPATLKASMGETVLDLGLADDATALRAGEVLKAVNDKPPVVLGKTVEVNVNDGPRVVTEALRILEQAGIAPTTLALREPSLDDVFLALTGHRTEGATVPDAADVPEVDGRRQARRRGRS